jgi:hypothetical protein
VSSTVTLLKQSRSRDSLQHTGEHQSVQWEEHVPVAKTSPSHWVEDCSLPDRGQQAIARNLELKPSSSGQLHFRDEPQAAIGLDHLDAPEVNSVTDMEQCGMRAPSPHACATG